MNDFDLLDDSKMTYKLWDDLRRWSKKYLIICDLSHHEGLLCPSAGESLIFTKLNLNQLGTPNLDSYKINKGFPTVSGSHKSMIIYTKKNTDCYFTVRNINQSLAS